MRVKEGLVRVHFTDLAVCIHYGLSLLGTNMAELLSTWPMIGHRGGQYHIEHKNIPS